MPLGLMHLQARQQGHPWLQVRQSLAQPRLTHLWLQIRQALAQLRLTNPWLHDRMTALRRR
jgi:hypothetical protein